MTVSAITNTTGSNAGTAVRQSLGQSDFIRLMTTQMKMQDPTDPVDNKEMIAQMAQFSTLAGSTETNATLNTISDKLDALIAAQKAANPTTMPTT